jgi:predicted Zn finger-like uncharacterized protein
MFTRCPYCLTRFEVDTALLAPARGRLCCGACGNEFDALACLAAAPDALATALPIAATTPPRIDPPADPAQTDLFDADRKLRAADQHVPSFARRQVSPASSGNGRWLALAAVLGVTLAVQIILAQRVELAADREWRAWLEPVCATLGCELPAWRDSTELSLAARSISPHPSVADALLVTATLQNDSRWSQAWPLLELTLSDLDGKPVARRRFTAEEYLGGPPSQPVLAPGQAAVAQLEIADPGKQAVAFAFDFL